MSQRIAAMPLRSRLAWQAINLLPVCICGIAALLLSACASIERIADAAPVDRAHVAVVAVDRFRHDVFTAADGTVLP